MTMASEYQDPDCNPQLERKFLIQDMQDAFIDNVGEVAIGSCRRLGMVALLKGRVEPIELEGEMFDERTYLTLISFRLPQSPFNIINFRSSDDEQVYGQNIRLEPTNFALDSLTEDDAIQDEWRRHQLARTRFNDMWSEFSLSILLREPLFFGIVPISTPHKQAGS